MCSHLKRVNEKTDERCDFKINKNVSKHKGILKHGNSNLNLSSQIWDVNFDTRLNQSAHRGY